MVWDWSCCVLSVSSLCWYVFMSLCNCAIPVGVCHTFLAVVHWCSAVYCIRFKFPQVVGSPCFAVLLSPFFFLFCFVLFCRVVFFSFGSLLILSLWFIVLCQTKNSVTFLEPLSQSFCCSFCSFFYQVFLLSFLVSCISLLWCIELIYIKIL